MREAQRGLSIGPIELEREKRERERKEGKERKKQNTIRLTLWLT